MPVPKTHYRYQQLYGLMMGFEHLAKLLASGLPLLSALQVTIAQSQQPLIQQTFRCFSNNVANGQPLHHPDANLPRCLPGSMIGFLTLAEQSGQFAGVIQHMVTEFKHNHQQRQQLLKAVRYPLAILAITLVIASGLLFFVLPQFTALFGQQQLPGLTRMLLSLRDSMSQYGMLLLAIICSMLCLLIALKRYSPKYWQQLARVMPLFGSLTELARLQQLFQRLSLLLSAGMNATSALTLCADSSAWVRTRQQCKTITTAIASGHSWLPAFQAAGINDALVVAYLTTGEQTGRIDTMMAELAKQLADRLTHQSQQQLGLIQPLLMLVLGGIIGTLLLAMYLPIFNLGQQF